MHVGTRVDTTGEFAVVAIDGDFDMSTAPSVRPVLQRTIADGGSRLVVDLTECSTIDSAGLGVVLGALRRTRAADGSVALVVPFGHLRRIFEACDLDRIFTLHATIDDATAELDDRSTPASAHSRQGPAEGMA